MWQLMHKYNLHRSSLCDKYPLHYRQSWWHLYWPISAPAELVSITHDRLYVVTLESSQWPKLHHSRICFVMSMSLWRHTSHILIKVTAENMCLWCVCGCTDLQSLHTLMSSPTEPGPWSKCQSVWRTQCSPDWDGPPEPQEPCNVLYQPAVNRQQKGLIHMYTHNDHTLCFCNQ